MLVQIGDIHFPELDREMRPVNDKDPQFPKILSHELPRTSLEVILTHLLTHLNQAPTAVLLAGDLTSNGDLQSYKACLQFLRDRTPSNLLELSHGQRVLIVPGNHDVNHALCGKENVTDKFQPLRAAVEEFGFPALAGSGVTGGRVPNDSEIQLLTLGLNSCLGCGERRQYRSEVEGIVSPHLPPGSFLSGNLPLHDELDLPLVSEAHFSQAIDQIKQSPASCLPIILAHHNLLPQKVPRLAIYSELLNAGWIRQGLLELKRPVLYLHGHIHDDPIDIVESAHSPRARIVSIAAPPLAPTREGREAKSGFNVIRVFYSRHSLPIGCEVELVRFVKWGRMAAEKRRIPLLPREDSYAHADEASRSVLEKVPMRPEFLTDLLERCQGHPDPHMTPETLAELVEQLEWLGLVKLEDREAPLVNRQVRRV